MKRIMVTGSRTWPETPLGRHIVTRAIATEIGVDQPAELVSGRCPTGADKIAEDWWEEFMSIDTNLRFPARWSVLGLRAGHVRNGQEIAMMPDVVLAFMLGQTSGTQDAINQAREAGIPVIAHYWPEPEKP